MPARKTTTQPVAPSSVSEYLEALPAERRDALKKVRAVIRKHLPKGFTEDVGFGMITYGVPLSKYPNTYNKQPLCLAALASQKNHMAVYLMSAYADPKVRKRFETAWKKTGKKLDMGQSCVRFKKVDDLALDVIADAIAAHTPDELIAHYEKARRK